VPGGPYTGGSGAGGDTGGPHAATEANPACVQSFTYTFAIDVDRAGAPHRTPKPEGYEGDGYVIVAHPDTEVVKQAMVTAIETIQVQYG